MKNIRYSLKKGTYSIKKNQKLYLIKNRDKYLYQTDEVGAFILELLIIPITLAEIVKRVVKEYDANEDKVKVDMSEYIKHLISENIIEKK